MVHSAVSLEFQLSSFCPQLIQLLYSPVIVKHKVTRGMKDGLEVYLCFDDCCFILRSPLYFDDCCFTLRSPFDVMAAVSCMDRMLEWQQESMGEWRFVVCAVCRSGSGLWPTSCVPSCMLPAS